MAIETDKIVLGGMVICRPAPLAYGNGTVCGFTLMSDLHIGAANIDYRRIEKELETAKEKGDRILINGDVFDLILPKDHKRFTPDVLHPRLRGRRDIINEVIKMGLEMLGPYANQIDMVGLGNHETSTESYHSIDPLKLLVYELEKIVAESDNKEHVVHYGGYTGFVDYRFRYITKKGDEAKGGQRWVVYYHHGSGGAAPVTKGMIDFNRKDVFIDSDVIWMGHKHNRLTSHVEKLSCPLLGRQPKTKDVRHIMTGSYQKTYVAQSQASVRKYGRRSNYAADQGMAPQGKGGARVELHFPPSQDLYEMKVIQ